METQVRTAKNRKIDGFTKDKEGTWTGPYVFIHTCDPQLGFIDVKAGGEGLIWDEEINLTRKVVDIVNQMRPQPKFLFVNGDLVHAYPGDGPHKIEQQKDLIDVLSKSQVPVFVTSGNHDIGVTPTPATVSDFSSWFGDDFFSFYVGGVFYIALNSQYFFDSSGVEGLAAEHCRWMREVLHRAKTEGPRHVIVFMHIPPFTSHPEEEDAFSNIPKKIRSFLLEEFAKAGVGLVFSGHWHRNGGGTWTGLSKDGKDLKVDVVVTTAIGKQLGNDRSGLTVVTVREKEVSHEYYALDDVPNEIVL